MPPGKSTLVLPIKQLYVGEKSRPAGDPYYALDCREDDYAWCNATPDGQLIPAIHFEQLRAGLDDYRYLLTLARLARDKAGTAATKTAEELVTARLAAFKLGQRDHDALFGPDDWQLSRRNLADAIEALQPPAQAKVTR